MAYPINAAAEQKRLLMQWLHTVQSRPSAAAVAVQRRTFGIIARAKLRAAVRP